MSSVRSGMGRFSSFTWSTGISFMSIMGTAGMVGTAAIAQTNQPLSVVYPPNNHETTANQIFLIGTAPAEGEVQVNGEAIARSPAGHFAPSFPLQLGENVFTLHYQEQELVVRVNRVSADPPAPVGTAFAEGSLTPAVDISRQPNEPICFSAIAPTNATVSVSLGNQTIPLLPQNTTDLPPNSAVLTLQNQPVTATANTYQGCGATTQIGNLGQPQFELTLNGETVRQQAPGTVEILSPVQFQVVEVTAASGTARTGPSTDHSRLTPLPTGTRATVTGREGEWYRLDYGAWIRATEIQVSESPVPPRSLIRSIRAEQLSDRTQITFPLQVPVPVSVNQGSDTFTLTLHNTTAQTDTILLNDDPLIERLSWQQISPDQIQYTFQLKTKQQWGYELAYEGTSLVLSLRHPPEIADNRSQPLAGISILLDPGHGGPEDLGSRGPTGYPEKEINLVMANLIRDRLIARGATVYMTREGDADLYPQDRVDLINQLEPAIALSIHYNALPDSGDAANTAGIGTFWYHPQAHSLAVFLHNHLVETRDRPSYGVFWNNLALTRPSIAPSVLLELGFMINPEEFEWIVDPEEQEQLAEAIAEGITEWFQTSEE